MRIVDRVRWDFARHCNLEMWSAWLGYLAEVRRVSWPQRVKLVHARLKRWRKRFKRLELAK